MRTLGMVFVNDEIIRVLFADSKEGRSLKIRKAGRLGVHLKDESIFLKDNSELLKQLKSGRTIKL